MYHGYMSRITYAIILGFLFCFTFLNGLPVFARESTDTGSGNVNVGPCGGGTIPNTFQSLCNGSKTSNIAGIIHNLIISAFVIAAILALAFLIWGGIKWIISGGDKAKVQAARDTIIAAVIGLILTLLSFFILSVVLGLFGLKLTDLQIPTLPRQ